MNCWVDPTPMLGVVGETEMAVTVFVAAVTVWVAEPLTPLSEAVTVDKPAATPVASPAEFTVATVLVVDVHVAVEVALAVEPSL